MRSKPPPVTPNNMREFIKTFDKLAYTHNAHEVWNDFVTLFSCTISNLFDGERSSFRTNQLQDISKRYSDDIQQALLQLMSITQDEYQKNSDQDFLGDIFTAMNLCSKARGQFFTPYPVSKFMASIMLGNPADEIKTKGMISVNDPCCGAGSMLIAATNVCKDQGINYERDVLFVAQDIDHTVAKMCYIQLSLLGCAGYVMVGDSLAMQPVSDENIWLLPGLFDKVWVDRGIMTLEEGRS